ncbi:adenylyltransferase/cytidyltransferase family protein [Actinomadura fibrosa]|uniref:Adenylyltransferase/cytidyltransferase family protein n=1 Tax=Actinomadura fibrosa TaxID=111802 RepID=A0ABW2XFA0_9ACTN|nr:adenylyltransferase/cytidyltransferase family protein [Actinomadura fibrosa]
MDGAVGFSPGVFDLFHVGHLDVLRRAERSCGRLVAGVLADELAEDLLGTRPIVPLIERMEIVGNCRHVAEVVALTHADLRRAWRDLRFDVLFAGPPDAVVPADAETLLDGTGARVVRFTDLVETASPALRAALAGESGEAGVRTSVA